MAELADAADSKSAEGNLVGVRPPLPAPIKSMLYEINASSDAFFCAQTVPKLEELLDALARFCEYAKKTLLQKCGPEVAHRYI